MWARSLRLPFLIAAGLVAAVLVAVGLSDLFDHRLTEAALAALTSAVILHFMSHSVKEG